MIVTSLTFAAAFACVVATVPNARADAATTARTQSAFLL